MRPILALAAVLLLAACGSDEPPAKPPAERVAEHGPVTPPPETDPLARPVDSTLPEPPPVVLPGEES